LINIKITQTGALFLTKSDILLDGNNKCFKIPLNIIQYIFLRRYLHEETGIDLFTSEHKSYFFNFVRGQRIKFLDQLQYVKLSNIKFEDYEPRRRIFNQIKHFFFAAKTKEEKLKLL
jgi:hypothetical protein